MRIVESREAEDCLLKDPDTGRGLLNPMASYNIVTFCVSGLPRITGNVNLTSDCVTLVDPA